MTRRNQNQQRVTDETAELRSRLEETEETLLAIRQYMVDAFVVNRANGIEIVTLHESEIPYRRMVEAMNEGAVTLISDGSIFYCNSRFSEMIQVECEKLVGTLFRHLIVPEEQSRFEEIFRNAGPNGRRDEFNLLTASGKRMPVQLSIYQLGREANSGIAVLATDLSERVQSEAKIRSLASELTRAEQEERHRISQVLHDDLQQRLFAIKAQLSFLSDVNRKDHLSPDVSSDLDQIQAFLSEAIAITRNLSIDLSPVVLHGTGLTESMAWLAARMEEQYGLQVELETKEDFNHLDDHMRMLLFQSIRELLFNIVKHAGVLEAKITLERVNERNRIRVSDDGKGFDAEAVLQNPKMAHGLLIIQDRLTLLGCHMNVISKPGKGTYIVIELPRARTSA
jgi:PAS domain S-box-containing protein